VARLEETLTTELPADEAFAFVADFANAEQWDPGVAWSRAVTNGPPEVGSRYLLGVRIGRGVTEMEYDITVLEPGRRVVLNGRGGQVSAVDDIRFEPLVTGTRIDYRADIELHGWLRLMAPFAGRAFGSVARNARNGMRRALDARASIRTVVA